MTHFRVTIEVYYDARSYEHQTWQSLRLNNTNATGAFYGVMHRLYQGVLYPLDVVRFRDAC
jgi:hypothetical protein